MSFKPISLIWILAIFLPFEEFILKWLPVSDRIYSLSRFGSELAIYSLFFIVIIDRFLRGENFRRTPIDSLLICFVALSLLSIYYNKAPFIGSLISLRTLLRYVTIFYIVVNLRIDEQHATKIIRIVIIVAFIESVIGVVQHFLGVGKFWLPRATDLEVGGYQRTFTALTTGIEEGAVLGTFGHSASLALFLVLAELLLLAKIIASHDKLRKGTVKLFLLFLFFFTGILFTYSRGSLLAVLLAIPILLYFSERRKLFFKFGLVSAFALILLVCSFVLFDVNPAAEYAKVKKVYVNPLDNITMIFTSDYLSAAKSSRLWVLFDVGGAIAKTGTLIGFSPDETTARLSIARVSSGDLEKILTAKAFEDVYWVAMLAYYGIIGLALFILILYRIFKCSIYVVKSSHKQSFVVLGLALGTLICVNLPLTFLIRTFENRSFGFYFWLLCGLIITEYNRIKRISVSSSTSVP